MGVEEYEVLHHSTLTAVVRKFATPLNFKGSKFFRDAPTDGDSVLIDIEHNPRHMAGYRHPDAPAAINKLMKVEQIGVVMPHMKEKVFMPARLLKNLRAPGTEHTPWGAQKVAREQEKIEYMIQRRREWARWQLLTTGKIDYSTITDGEIAFSVDFGIANDHIITLSGTDMWSDYENSDPVTVLQDAIDQFTKDADIEPTQAMVNRVTMKHMIKHPVIKDFMGDDWKTQVGQTGMISRFMGLDWDRYDLGHKPLGGTFTKFLPDGYVVLQGPNPHDEFVGIFPDDEATSPGRFSKSWDEDDPDGFWVLVGINHCPSAARIEEFMVIRTLGAQ